MTDQEQKVQQAITLLTSIIPSSSSPSTSSEPSKDKILTTVQHFNAVIKFVYYMSVEPTRRAMSALRRVQERLKFKSAEKEHKRNFSPYGRKTRKQSKSDTWMAKFVCLANKDQTSAPLSVTDKIDLIEAGLGEKKIQIDLNYATMQFQSKILNEFPKLDDAGGFELLQCIPNTKKLESISSIVCN